MPLNGLRGGRRGRPWMRARAAEGGAGVCRVTAASVHSSGAAPQAAPPSAQMRVRWHVEVTELQSHRAGGPYRHAGAPVGVSVGGARAQ